MSNVFLYSGSCLLNMGTQNIRSRKVQILVKQGRRVITTFVTLFQIHGAIVYRLGHKVFILGSGVRFPVALPKFRHISLKVQLSDSSKWCDRIVPYYLISSCRLVLLLCLCPGLCCELDLKPNVDRFDSC